MTDGNILKAFRRNDDGSWTCIAPVRIDHPRGRIEVTVGTRLAPNTVFMGVDLAAWLEELAKNAGK
jgi:hypothetical protein